MIIQLDNGVPIGDPILESNFKQLFPTTSFPAYLTPGDVEPFGFGMYEFSRLPELGRYEKAIEGAPTRNERGFWMQSWNVVPMTEEERQSTDEAQAGAVRAERFYKLLHTDWTQLPNSPVDSAIWEAYRQELRDITDQEGFPWDVVWPEPPGELI